MEGNMSKAFTRLMVAIVAIVFFGFPAQAERLNKNVDGLNVAAFGGTSWAKGMDHTTAFSGGLEIGGNILLPDTPVWMGGSFTYRFSGPKHTFSSKIVDKVEKTTTTKTELLDDSSLGTLSIKLGFTLGHYIAPYAEGGMVLFGGSHQLLTEVVVNDVPFTSTTEKLRTPLWFVGQGIMIGGGNPWTVGVRGLYFSDTSKVAEVVVAYHL
jgi:hypothetical protein